MLIETVGQFFQAQAHIFQADFLADHEKRQSWKSPVHCPHNVAQQSAITNAGVEQAKRRWPGLNMGQLSLLVRAKYLIEVVSFSKVQGQPFKVAELQEKILEKLR